MSSTRQMKLKIFILSSVALSTLWACGVPEQKSDSVSVLDSYPSVASKWSSPTINVCWENSTDAYPEEKGWVKSRVATEYANKTKVNLVGWQRCRGGDAGVHVTISDAVGSNPHTQALGKYLSGVQGGMELNFTFNNWSSSCRNQRRGCIEAIAVHEFGHAIGLAHEQNRPDTPSTCRQPRQGSMGDTVVGSWDATSVMNYCNPVYNNAGRLSSGDVAGIARLYGVKN